MSVCMYVLNMTEKPTFTLWLDRNEIIKRTKMKTRNKNKNNKIEANKENIF